MRNIRVWLVASGLMVALSVGGAAWQTSITPGQAGVAPGGGTQAAAPQPLKPGSGVILGRVVEGGGTTGVAGALVTLSSSALGPSASAFANGTPGGPRKVVADAQGQFVFRDLPAGAYNIDSSAPGYVNGVYGQNRIITIRRTLDFIRTVEIAESDRLVQVSVRMFRKGGISGRVVDEAGEPMVGVSVTVLARMTDWGGPIMQVAQIETTDDRGMYHVDVVPGDYLTGVLAATTTVPLTLVDGFVQAQAVGGAALQTFIGQTTSVAGLLPRGYGTRVGPLLVSQFGNRNAPVVPPMPADGSSWFYPSTYHPSSLASMDAVVVNVAPGEEKTGIDIHVRPIPVRRISGRIVGPSGPAGGMGLRLISADPTVQRTSPATLIDLPQAVADGTGAFTFVGVAPGAYTLYVIKRPTAGDPSILWAAEAVSVSDTDVRNVEVLLKPGALITGRVVFDGAVQPPVDGARRVAVTARGVPGSPAALTGLPAGSVDASGRFSTPPLVPGPYQMSLTAGVPGWTLRSITTGGQNAADKAFQLTASGITDLVITFTDKRSTLTGLVRDADGQPGTSTTVAVFPTDKGLWRLPEMASRRVQTAAPQRDGRYAFGGLPDGEYFIVAADWPSADFSDAQVLTKLIAHATRLTIIEGQTSTQDLRVAVVK